MIKRILLLSRFGELGASSRVRSLQYLPILRSQGFEVIVKPLFSDAYLRAQYNGCFSWQEAIKGYIFRMLALGTVRHFDLVIIEKELFPFLPAIAERLLKFFGTKYIVDYDDALFHRYDCHSNPWVRRLLGKKIDTVMGHARVVIAGNQYLADRAVNAEAEKVEIIPTVIDVDRYRPLLSTNKKSVVTIGWIGTPHTSRYLKSLLPVFSKLKEEFVVRFVAIGANPVDFIGTVVEVWPWSEDTEVESIQQFDIGVMPLVDSPWERGKCGYKLIQYMACGLPVVASPVGVNSEIVKAGLTGYLADTVYDWEKFLGLLIRSSPENREQMGRSGRQIVEKWYTTDIQSMRLFDILAKTID